MTMQGVPTVFPNGVTNAQLDSFGARVPCEWPPQLYTFFTDFDKFNAALGATGLADWLNTPSTAGAGTSSVVTDAFGGILLITLPSASDDFGNSYQWLGGNALADVAETFIFTPGKELWFAARFALSEVVQSDLIIGLAVATLQPITTAPTDGVFFIKSDGSAAMSLRSSLASSATNVAVGSLVAATFVEAAFHYNGIDKISAFINGNPAGSMGITTLPITELAVTFGVQNGDTAARTASFDWIFASRER